MLLVTVTFEGFGAYRWFSLNISATCSLSHSASFRAQKAKSSDSSWAIFKAEARSSASHGAEPIGNLSVTFRGAMAQGQGASEGGHNDRIERAATRVVLFVRVLCSHGEEIRNIVGAMEGFRWLFEYELVS